LLEVDIRRFREGSIIPTRAEDGSAGLDVYAWTPDVRGADRRVQVIPAHKSGTISTGLNIRIPRGYCITVIPRSGLAFKNNITVVNSPGLIDSSYDGDGEDFEIKIGLMNHSDTDFEVKHGDRVAQIKLEQVVPFKWNEVSLDNINRPGNARVGGFGSTGK
jgi:dUTP pyrophosphatase